MTITSTAFVLAAAMTLGPQQPAPQSTPMPFGPPQGRGSATSTLQGFNIVLVAGEMQAQGHAPDDNVPAAAQKALNDMKDFLPFKHYRLLDSQWTLCCSSIEVPITGRLRATLPPEGDRKFGAQYEYVFHLAVRRGADQGKLPIAFVLQPASASRTPAAQEVMSAVRESELEKRISELRRELDTLEDEIPRREKSLGRNHPEVQALLEQVRRVNQRHEQTKSELAHGKVYRSAATQPTALIDSNFTMDVGETVVVGTSAIGGNKALIAIVTAVRKGTR